MPSEKEEFKNEMKRIELLKKMPQYRKINDGLCSMIKMSIALKDQLYEDNSNYEAEYCKFISECEEYEAQRDLAFEKYNSCLLVKDRFDKRSILSHIENDITQLNEANTVDQSQAKLASCRDHNEMMTVMNDLIQSRTNINMDCIKVAKLKEIV